MFIAMLCCYGLSCAIHLVFCFLMAERMRRISKPFCLLFLLLSCLFSPSSPSLLALGLLLGLIGDVLMLFKRRRLCLAGAMACFAGNHLAYICVILSLSFGQTLPDMRLAGFAVLSSAIILFATFSLSLANSLKYPAFSSTPPFWRWRSPVASSFASIALCQSPPTFAYWGPYCSPPPIRLSFSP